MLTPQKHLFDLEDDITYLNVAFMSPQLKTVTEAGLDSVRIKSKPYQLKPGDFFSNVKELKKLFAQLVDTTEAWERIAIIPSVSYGMTAVANNVPLKAGDEIVILEEQFPSNVYPWLRAVQEKGGKIVTIRPPEGKEDRGKRWNEAILASIHENTALVSLPHVHWADGTLVDLPAVREATRKVGAWLVVDGTQSVGALPFSVKEIQPDVLVCAGYKWLMGPYSIGLAYYGPVMDGGVPLEESWMNRKDSHKFSQLANYQSDYQPMASRYSVGEQSNFVLVPMQISALRQLLQWTPQAVQEYTAKISKKMLVELKSLGFFVEEEQYRASHLFGIHFPEGFPIDELKVHLEKENIHVSYRGEYMRVSPHVYNTEEDFDKLLSAIRHCAKFS